MAPGVDCLEHTIHMLGLIVSDDITSVRKRIVECRLYVGHTHSSSHCWFGYVCCFIHAICIQFISIAKGKMPFNSIVHTRRSSESFDSKAIIHIPTLALLTSSSQACFDGVSSSTLPPPRPGAPRRPWRLGMARCRAAWPEGFVSRVSIAPYP